MTPQTRVHTENYYEDLLLNTVLDLEEVSIYLSVGLNATLAHVVHEGDATHYGEQARVDRREASGFVREAHRLPEQASGMSRSAR